MQRVKSFLIFGLLVFSKLVSASETKDCSATLVELILAEGKQKQLSQIYCKKGASFFRNCAGAFITDKKVNVAEKFLFHLKEAELVDFMGKCSEEEKDEKVTVCNSSLAGLFTDFKIPGTNEKVSEKLSAWRTISEEEVKRVKSLVLVQLERAGISQFAGGPPEIVKGGPTIQSATGKIVSIKMENSNYQVVINPDGSTDLKDLKNGKIEHSCSTAAPSSESSTPQRSNQN